MSSVRRAPPRRFLLGRRSCSSSGAPGRRAWSPSSRRRRGTSPNGEWWVSAKPNALVLFNPAVDTSRDSPGLTERFGKRGREASPAQHVIPGLPPILILHGKADATVPFADVEQFCAAATERGNQFSSSIRRRGARVLQSAGRRRTVAPGDLAGSRSVPHQARLSRQKARTTWTIGTQPVIPAVYGVKAPL